MMCGQQPWRGPRPRSPRPRTPRPRVHRTPPRPRRHPPGTRPKKPRTCGSWRWGQCRWVATGRAILPACPSAAGPPGPHRPAWRI
uniref:Uncharacterized protein n=1 Tax=Human herpesvirus 2 TaxID=10310 RepID=A0A481TMK6_HHV2|nr:hypothetical protein [Human alphaherpesvirus 2]